MTTISQISGGAAGATQAIEEGGASSFFAGLSAGRRGKRGRRGQSFAGLLERRTLAPSGPAALRPQREQRAGLAPSSKAGAKTKATKKRALHASELVLEPRTRPTQKKHTKAAARPSQGRPTEAIAAGMKQRPAATSRPHEVPVLRAPELTAATRVEVDAPKSQHRNTEGLGRRPKPRPAPEKESFMPEVEDVAAELFREVAQSAQPAPKPGSAPSQNHALPVEGRAQPAAQGAVREGTAGLQAPERIAASKSAERIAEVVVERLQVMRGEESQSALLELSAGELGHIKVHIDLSGQSLRVQLSAEQSRTRDQLRAQLAEIGRALEDRGIDGAQLEVAASLAGEDAGEGAEQRPGEESGKGEALRERWEEARDEQRRQRPTREERDQADRPRRRVHRRPAQPADPGGINVVV